MREATPITNGNSCPMQTKDQGERRTRRHENERFPRGTRIQWALITLGMALGFLIGLITAIIGMKR